MPDPYVQAIVNDLYDIPQNEKNILSVSSLISPVLQRQLKIRNWDKVEVDVRSLYDSFIGNCIHDYLERYESKGIIKEKRITLQNGDIEISGKPDLFYVDEKKLVDYKTVKTNTLARHPEGKREWIEQLNCYGYLLSTIGHKVEKLEIHAFKKDPKFIAFSEEVVPIEVIPITLWKKEDQKEFIFTKKDQHVTANSKPIDNIIICSKEERWSRPDCWAVYKNKNKRAKLFYDEVEADEYIQHQLQAINNKDKYRVEFRKGEDTRCLHYCSVKEFCPYGREL